MQTKKDLLSAIGLNEKSPWISFVLVITFLICISILGDAIEDVTSEYHKFLVSSVLGVIVFILYKILEKRELKATIKFLEHKKEILMVTPSNLDLLISILSKQEVQHIDFIQTKVNPSKEYNEIVEYLHQHSIIFKIHEISNIDNYKELEEQFYSVINKKENCTNLVVDITTGKSLSSSILQNLAFSKNIDVGYLSSEYDDQNKPIKNSSRYIQVSFEKA